VEAVVNAGVTGARSSKNLRSSGAWQGLEGENASHVQV
jgi:hypothetical protein